MTRIRLRDVLIARRGSALGRDPDVAAADTSPCDVRSLIPVERVDEDSIGATAFGAGIVHRLVRLAVGVQNLCHGNLPPYSQPSRFIRARRRLM